MGNQKFNMQKNLSSRMNLFKMKGKKKLVPTEHSVTV